MRAGLFGFLTTEANAEVGAVNAAAIPVILTEHVELDAWLRAPWFGAKDLQRPLPHGALRIVAESVRRD